MFFSFILAVAATLVPLPIVSAFPHPFQVVRNDFTPIALRQVDVVTQLGPQLSKNATIYAEDDPRFANATRRWQAYAQPQISVVVEPGTEDDVATTVKYANSNSIGFLAKNRGHGSTKTLGQLKNGIEINIRVLDQIIISADGTSAFMGGGVYDDQVMRTLWNAGYVTGTGSCGCVGLMGPALGGGHGRYQGFYGLIADMILSMNVVLSNGSAIVVSENSAPDLWWAMRGAGHNFGIVTSLTQSIHKRTTDSWFYATYIFGQDKLEPLFESLNTQLNNGTQPKELMHYGVVSWVPELSTTEPMLIWTFYYVGTAEEAAPFMAPFDELKPLSVTKDSIPYPDIPDATGTGSNNPLCRPGLTHMQFAVNILTYNITANRQIFDLFQKTTLETPSLNGSILVFEAYSVEGVKAVDFDSTAFPHRGDNIIVDIVVSYPPDSSLDEQAIAWGRETRQIWYKGEEPGRPLNTYLNYAFGDEPAGQVYGYEPWRLEKLTEAKRRYDPENKFGFYQPIPL